MKIFLVLVAIIGLAVFGVKWFTNRDAELRQKEEALAAVTPPPPPKPTPWARSALDNPRQPQGSALDRKPASAPRNMGSSDQGRGFGSTALDRPAYK